MEKIAFLAFIFALIICTSPVHSKYYKPVPYAPPLEKKTHLHFYVHDILSGDKSTAIQIAGPNNSTHKSDDPTPFGTTLAIDDPLIESPEITSKTIGNMRGLYVSASQDGFLTLVLYVDIGFTSGELKGSSLSVVSRNPVTEGRREMAVVGGRGKFRMARGVVLVNTHFFNTTNGDVLLECNVEVVHPCRVVL